MQGVWLSPNATSTGSNNVAVGYQALTGFTTGDFNVAIGSNALQTNTTGTQNTAIGSMALSQADAATGNNVAVGYQALKNASGGDNVAVGTYTSCAPSHLPSGSVLKDVLNETGT